MKIYICIIYLPIKNEIFQAFLEMLDENNAEIHVFEMENLENDDFNESMQILSQYIEYINSDDNLCLVANSTELLNIILKLYDSMIHAYILFNYELKYNDLNIVDVYSFKGKLYLSDPQYIKSFKNDILYIDSRIYAFDFIPVIKYLNDFINIKAKQLIQVFSIQQRMDSLNNTLYGREIKRDECLKEYIYKMLSDTSFMMSDFTKIYLYSFLIKMFHDKKYVDTAIRLVQSSKEFTVEIKFFLYYQMMQWFFLDPSLGTELSKELMSILYRSIYVNYFNKLIDTCEFIPESERDKELIIVFTGQLLDLSHGPTKTVLDRCYILQLYMKKQVLLINTAEVLSIAAAIPIWDMRYGLYQKKYNELTEIPYKNTAFPLIQYTDKMPNLLEIMNIINIVKQQKPHYVISVGPTLVADLCGNIVPVITIATVLSSVMNTEGQFQQIGRKLNETDLLNLKKRDIGKEHVIEGVFTYEFKPQVMHFTKVELGIPNDKFILITAGARLDDEITEEFILMLNRLYNYSVFIVFIGRFELMYDKYCYKYPNLKVNSIYLGFQSDVLAIFECCDLYINPKRRGGGGAILEAMSKGLPSLTIDYGDAAVNAGEDFIVNDYECMEKEIIRYIIEPEYYKKKSLMARSRAEMMCDSEQHFVNVIQTAIEREAFYYPPKRLY